jgi:hypothetical protein
LMRNLKSCSVLCISFFESFGPSAPPSAYVPIDFGCLERPPLMAEYCVEEKFVLVMPSPPTAPGDCTLVVVAFFDNPNDCVVTEGIGCF